MQLRQAQHKCNLLSSLRVAFIVCFTIDMFSQLADKSFQVTASEVLSADSYFFLLQNAAYMHELSADDQQTYGFTAVRKLPCPMRH